MKTIGDVVEAGLCTGCGACAAVTGLPMQESVEGPVPHTLSRNEGNGILKICPGYGIDYPSLYKHFYGKYPNSWLLGNLDKTWTGHSLDRTIRHNAASGGILTHVLCYLLETNRVDAVICVCQDLPEPPKASVVIASTPEEIMRCSQSVYIPVSTLDALNHLQPGKRYAITCLPDQAAALRQLQLDNHPAANQVKYVLGPFTGTALQPAAIQSILRSHHIPKDDSVKSLKWRAGEWPGHLEIHMSSGRVIKSKKVYYNYLIPFFVTQASLQSIDFANEFCDLSVGDAWSPAFEANGKGHSVVYSRSPHMTVVLEEMLSKQLLSLEDLPSERAADMHGHMIDFKKRGSFIRNHFRRLIGLKSPVYGMFPARIPLIRYLVEIVIVTVLIICRNPLSRAVLPLIPEDIIGPVFNTLRLKWKQLSKPTKRKGLRNLQYIISLHGQRGF